MYKRQLESSDADVEKILKKETDAAIAASFNVLRSRIDHFGVTQPNIMPVSYTHLRRKIERKKQACVFAGPTTRPEGRTNS